MNDSSVERKPGNATKYTYPAALEEVFPEKRVVTCSEHVQEREHVFDQNQAGYSSTMGHAVSHAVPLPSAHAFRQTTGANLPDRDGVIKESRRRHQSDWRRISWAGGLVI